MAVSQGFRDFVLDQLGQIAPPVRGRPMFGGLGIYTGELFFALIADETLYLKVDEQNRDEFERIGSKPFQPFPDKPGIVSYYDVPLGMLESVPRLRPLVESAVEAAKTSKKSPAGHRKRSSAGKRNKGKPKR